MVAVIVGGALLWGAMLFIFYPAADAVLILYALCVIHHWLGAVKSVSAPPPELPDAITAPDGSLYEKRRKDGR